MPPPLPAPSSVVNAGTNTTRTSKNSVRVAVTLMRDIVEATVRDTETNRKIAAAAEGNERGGQSNSVVYVFR